MLRAVFSRGGLQSGLCSGPCQEGYMCGNASTSARERPCGGPQWYCPEGSGQRVPVQLGYYSAGLPGDSSGLHAIEELPCEDGHYCPGPADGRMYPCGADREFPAAVYCPPKATAPVAVDPQYYSVGGADESLRSGQAICPAGMYCSQGVAHLCPAGRYGSAAGLTDPNCSGPCGQGFACPEGSTSPDAKTGVCQAGYYCATGSSTTESPCGGADVYCPRGSAAPLPVQQGYYSLPLDEDEDLRWSVQRCEPGYLCEAGKREPCGADTFYCVKGARTPVQAGYYSTGGTAETRTGERQCEPGHYCRDAVRHECPAGRYGAAAGLTESTCTGPCDAGTFGNVGGQRAPTCVGSCSAGYWCPEGSTLAKQNPCSSSGEPTSFCPEGSSQSSPVRAGYYATPLGCSSHCTGEEQRTEKGLFVYRGKRHACPADAEGRGVKEALAPPLAVQPPLAWPSEVVQDPVVRFRLQDGTATATGNLTTASTGAVAASGARSVASLFEVDGQGQLRTRSPVLFSDASAASGAVSVNVEIFRHDDAANVDVCVVAVRVWDTNQAPTFAGGASEPVVFHVAENSPAGTVIGTLVATDGDVGQTLTYSVVSQPTTAGGGEPFSLGTIDGKLQVREAAAFDYEAQQYLEFVAVVNDNAPGGESLNTTVRVRVNIDDVDDLDLRLVSVMPGPSGVPVSSVATLNGQGGDVLRIEGSGFDEIGTIQVTYGSGTFSYTAVGCRAVVRGAAIECQTAAGVGEGHRVDVQITTPGGKSLTTRLAAVLAYAPPSITRVIGAGTLATAGGTVVELRGAHFGPPGPGLTVQYESETRDGLWTVPCVVVDPSASSQGQQQDARQQDTHQQAATCTTSAGAGGRLRWIAIDASGRRGTPTPYGPGYRPPKVLSVSPLIGPTMGGTTVEVRGRDFPLTSKLYIGGEQSELTSVSSELLVGIVPTQARIIDPWSLSAGASSSSPSSNESAAGTTGQRRRRRLRTATTGTSPGVAVQIAGSGSMSNVNVTFAFEPPEIFSIEVLTLGADASAASGGGSSSASTATDIITSPTQQGGGGSAIRKLVSGTAGGAILKLVGQNFGGESCGGAAVWQRYFDQLAAPAQSLSQSQSQGAVVTASSLSSSFSGIGGDATAKVAVLGPNGTAGNESAAGTTLTTANITSANATTQLADYLMRCRVEVGGAVCKPLTYGHSEIRCSIPAGTGSVNFVRLFGGGSPAGYEHVRLLPSMPASLLRMAVAYDPPTVRSVTPPTGTLNGGTVLTIMGTNFGPSSPTAVLGGVAPALAGTLQVDLVSSPTYLTRGCRWVSGNMGVASTQQEQQGSSSTSTITGSSSSSSSFASSPSSLSGNPSPKAKQACPCDVKAGTRTQTSVQCITRPGIGPDHQVVVSVADQWSSDLLGRFSYDPPEVRSVQPSVLGGRNTSDNPVALELFGDNFGVEASPVEVLLGDVSCVGSIWQTRQDFSTWEQDQANSAAAQPDAYVSCKAPVNLTAGRKRLRVTIAGYNRSFDGLLNVECDSGYYSVQPIGVCAECSEGAICERGKLPRSRPGYGSRRLTRSELVNRNPLALAQANQLVAADDSVVAVVASAGGTANATTTSSSAAPPAPMLDADIIFEQCTPKKACLGNDTCGVGYETPQICLDPAGKDVPRSECNAFEEDESASRCSKCARGYFQLSYECHECPKQVWIWMLLYGLALVVLGGVAFILLQKGPSIGVVGVGLDYFQVLSMFSGFNLHWPKSIKTTLDTLSVSNLNIELVSPECAVPDLSYTNKWVMVQSAPFILIAVGLVYMAAKTAQVRLRYRCRRALKGNKARGRGGGGAEGADGDKAGPPRADMDRLVNSMIMMFYFIYLYEVRMAMELFSCEEKNGIQVLRAVPSERCYEGDTFTLLRPFATVAIIFYSVLLPAWFLYIVVKNKNVVEEDQILRMQGKGYTKETNPHYSFRKKYNKLYYRFKPKYFYWTNLVFLRKFCLAAIAMLFTQNPTFQAASCIMVLFICYAMTTRARPYLRNDLHEGDHDNMFDAAQHARGHAHREAGGGNKARQAFASAGPSRSTLRAMVNKSPKNISIQKSLAKKASSSAQSLKNVKLKARQSMYVKGTPSSKAQKMLGIGPAGGDLGSPSRRMKPRSMSSPGGSGGGGGGGGKPSKKSIRKSIWGAARSQTRLRSSSKSSKRSEAAATASTAEVETKSDHQQQPNSATKLRRAASKAALMKKLGGASKLAKFRRAANKVKLMNTLAHHEKQSRLERAKSLGRKAARAFVTDYNTMDCAFFITSIIVLLSGVMYESGYNVKLAEVSDGQTTDTADEDYVLTSFVLFVVIASTIFFSWNLLRELFASLRYYRKHGGGKCRRNEC
eukprot:g2249.t1